MRLLRLYHPLRVIQVARVLVTIFLLIRKKDRWLGMSLLPPARLVQSIEMLGASFIKLAQVLATRADFFDGEYLAALRTLHDRLPPMVDADFREVFARAFTTGAAFSSFDKEPIACASIGQVHCARLTSGEAVAVKLRRNGIEQVVREDIRILNLFLLMLRPLFSEYTRNSIEAVLAAFSKTIVQEVDMACELRNLERFRETYAGLGVRTPAPYPALTTVDALVMSFESGIRFDDREGLARIQVNGAALMEQLVLLYVEQMLVTGFFHADPHPGNLLVTEQGELVLLDFGMVSRIPNDIRRAMIMTVKAAYDHDFEQLIQAATKLGIITDAAPREDLVILAEEIFRIFDNEQLSASNMQELAFGIMDALKAYPFKLPQEIVYVMRASSIIEGLGTSFIDNYNGIKDVLPVLRSNLPRALGERNSLFSMVTHEIGQLPLTLYTARHLLETMADGNLRVRLSSADHRALIAPLCTMLNRLAVAALLVAAAFYGASQLPPTLYWISPLCFSFAALRILTLKRQI